MHELSLCRAIVDTVTEHAGGREVERVNLRIGHLRQVVPETLQFCWQMQVEGTPFHRTELLIDHVPAIVDCADCGRSTALSHPVLRCGWCNGTTVQLVTGEEFLIESIDLAKEHS